MLFIYLAAATDSQDTWDMLIWNEQRCELSEQFMILKGELAIWDGFLENINWDFLVINKLFIAT